MKPTGWFRVVDAQFAFYNITEDVPKYNHVLTALENDTSAAVEGFLDSQPEENLYYSCYVTAYPRNLVELFVLFTFELQQNIFFFDGS